MRRAFALSPRGLRCFTTVLCATASGCAESGSSPPSDEPESLVASALPVADASAAAHLRMPGPGRARGPAMVAENERCVGCHAYEAREWADSRHRAAFENEAFVAALAIEGPVAAAFCRGCHAPESDPGLVPSPAEASLGVGCVTCHLGADGAVLAAGSSPGRQPASGDMPHVVERSAEFGHTGACASCHEFRFPFARGDHDAVFMQTTVREHARSQAADRSCASCHMSKRAEGRSHRFDVRDPSWIASALNVSVIGTDHASIVVSLSREDPAHAFPTGDLFRRVEVGAALRSASGTELATARQYLARHFVLESGSSGRVLARDDRVFDEPAAVELDLSQDIAGAAGGTVHVWVTYQRVAQTWDGRDPIGAAVESSVPLFSASCRVELSAKKSQGFVIGSCRGVEHHASR